MDDQPIIERIDGTPVAVVADADGCPLIDTAEGPKRQTELAIKVGQRDDGGSLTMTRRYFYRGRLVREDRWVTLKSGLQTGVEKGT
jgi:hypothetical protein